jgi:pSer/pThr/pTyr-binding forkhead associated (FHA) protein
LIDRIIGRSRGRRYRGRTRSRSEPTIQLPKSGGDHFDTPAAPERVITQPEQHGPPRPYSQSTPPLGTPVVASAAARPDPGSPDAPTQYYQTAAFKKDEVMGVLIAIDGELKGEIFKLYDGENKLGRAEASDVVLASKWISRDHAMVVHQEGVFAIVPLTEKNRTYVNDREVDGAELSDGDTIRLGHTTFRFRSVEGL